MQLLINALLITTIIKALLITVLINAQLITAHNSRASHVSCNSLVYI